MSEYVKLSNDRSYRQNEHVRVAEEKLGRKLGKKEVVHHVDEDKGNNDPHNLMVLRSTADHNRIHADIPYETFQTKDGSVVVVTVQRECPHCHRMFVPFNNRDVHCSLICYGSSRLTKIPSKETLEEMVKDQPATKVAAHFGVSDVTIRKWCDRLGIEKADGRKLKKIRV